MSNNPYESPSETPAEDVPSPPHRTLTRSETAYVLTLPLFWLFVMFSCAGMMARFGPYMSGSRTEGSCIFWLSLAIAVGLTRIGMGIALGNRDTKAIVGYLLLGGVLLLCLLAIAGLVVSWILVP